MSEATRFRFTNVDLPLFAVLVRGLSDRKITEIACGPQHAIAMDEAGYVRVAL